MVKLRLATLCLAGSVALTLFSGCMGLWPTQVTPEERTVVFSSHLEYNRRVFDITWDAVRRHYYDAGMNGVDWNAARDRHRKKAENAVDDTELYAAINAMLDELKDEHTYAATPDEVEEDRRHHGVLVGLISSPFGEDETERLVLDVLPGSSAAALGVKPGWVLVSVEGRAPTEVLGPGRLQSGQKVLCQFLDNTDTIRMLTLTASPVSVDPIRSTAVLEGGVVLMRFDRFDLETARWVRAALKLHQKAPGIIVDLRQNPGGEALALARSLGEFFPRSVPMGRFVRRNGYDEQLRASPGLVGARYRGKVAVLVSENSGSSAEIFAYAMQERSRGFVVGTKTAGAVLGAETGALPAGGELQVSVRDYRTADDKRLEGIGVIPDIVVETRVEDLRAGRDPVLEAALERLAASEAKR